MDLADEGRKYDFQNFQSIASICLTTDCVPLLTGVTTNPPPIKPHTKTYINYHNVIKIFLVMLSLGVIMLYLVCYQILEVANIGIRKLGSYLFQGSAN